MTGFLAKVNFLKKKKQSGFTLLEVLISMMILGFLTVSIFTIFSQTINAWSKAAQDMRKYANIQAFFDRISIELTAATINSWGTIYAVGYPSGVGCPQTTTQDAMFFVCNVSDAMGNQSGELAEIGYWLDPAGNIKRYYKGTDVDYSDPSYSLYTSSPPDSDIETIASDIDMLYFCYWEEGTTDWKNLNDPTCLRVWDSRLNVDSVMTPGYFADDRKLPSAVKVVVMIHNDVNRIDEYFSTVIYIPESEPYIYN